MAFKRIITQDKNLQLMQDYSAESFRPLEQSPLTQGNMLQSIALTSGQDNLVSHKLMTTPQFFIVTQLDTNSVVWSPLTAALSNKSADISFINLWCTASCTISLWVR